ncbi:MAG: hypothetical protein HC803_03100 [Saprospiraceae bacterium]|nr:hypothetical protein [Saprospiraceae bacterium]
MMMLFFKNENVAAALAAVSENNAIVTEIMRQLKQPLRGKPQPIFSPLYKMTKFGKSNLSAKIFVNKSVQPRF